MGYNQTPAVHTNTNHSAAFTASGVAGRQQTKSNALLRDVNVSQCRHSANQLLAPVHANPHNPLVSHGPGKINGGCIFFFFAPHDNSAKHIQHARRSAPEEEVSTKEVM